MAQGRWLKIKKRVVPKPPRVPKAPARLMEECLTEALQAAGYTVVPAERRDTLATLQARYPGVPDEKLVAREYVPRAKDLVTGRCKLWRADFAWPALRFYVETDGFHGSGRSRLGGHRTWSGFHRDRAKDRALALAGWRCFRFGPADFKEDGLLRVLLEIHTQVERILQDTPAPTQKGGVS